MTDPVGAFLRYLAVEKDASAHTIRSYQVDLEQFRAFLAGQGESAFAAVDSRALRAYLAALPGRGLDRATVARKLAAVRSCLRFLARRGALRRNPARQVRGPRLGRKLVSFLPLDESLALLDGAAGTRRDQAILELLYASGLRVSELAGLDLGDVDRDARTVRVLGKGRKERIVPFGEAAARALALYLAENPDRAGVEIGRAHV